MHVSSQRRPHLVALAFTLVELLVLLVVVGVLLAVLVPVVAHAKAKSRASTCMSNLQHLGTAFAMYDVESGGRIPPAAWRVRPGMEMTWDDWIDWQMGGELSEVEKWAAAYSGDKLMPYLVCPSATDLKTVGQGAPHRRSYAMPKYIHDPQRAPWPPRVRSRTGVGVVWDFREGNNPDPNTAAIWEMGELGRADGLQQVVPIRRHAAVETAFIRRPAGTILLTERLGTTTLRGAVDGAALTTAAEQLASGSTQASGALPHKTGAHYLMVDGHVEQLAPEETTGENLPLDQQSALWTITSRD